MTKETIEKVVTITHYIASDGKRFVSKGECEHHEWKLTADTIFIAYERGARTESQRVFSTRELAEESVSLDPDSYTILCVYVDEYTKNK